MSTTLSLLENKAQAFKKPKLILFDLDGTLLDSAEGVFAAIEHALESHGLKPAFNRSELKPFTGYGVSYLLRRICPSLSDQQLQALKDDAFSHYKQQAAFTTSAYPKIKPLLQSLKQHRIDWGIITSKTRGLTEAVIDKIPDYKAMKILICRDDLPCAKPHPMALCHAMRKFNLPAACVLYVGDSLSDMRAAKYAGCRAILAGYGYLPEAADDWPYAAKIEHPEQLQKWIISLSV